MPKKQRLISTTVLVFLNTTLPLFLNFAVGRTVIIIMKHKDGTLEKLENLANKW